MKTVLETACKTNKPEMLSSEEEPRCETSELPLLFLLSGGSQTNGACATGEDIEHVCNKIQKDEEMLLRLRKNGILCVLGDDRGLTPEDEREIEAPFFKHKEFHKKSGIFHVSLGPDVLFTNQCVVLLNHYLDKCLHSCDVKAPRKM